MTSQETVHSALEWIIGVVDRHHVPYQVVGGLAAIAHGGARSLNDIDLYAPLAAQHDLLGALSDHTIWGPEQFRDETWDLVFMKLEFEGVRIEIGDTSSVPRYFDRARNTWTEQDIDFSSSERIVVFGVAVNVMPLDQLLVYKIALGRPLDLEDLRELRVS